MNRTRGARVAVALALVTAVPLGCGSSALWTASTSTEPVPLPDVPPASPTNLHLAAVGDVLLDRGPWEAIKANGMQSVLPVVAAHLQRADVTFANLECPLSSVGARDPMRSVFRADPSTVEVLLHGGFDVVSLANNHTLNSGHEALVQTIDHLETAGIGYVGAARDEEHGSDPAFLQVRGLSVGFMAYTDLDFEHGSYSRVDEDLTTLRAQIAAGRAACDVLIVSYHWGTMDRDGPSTRQVQVAHASIDAGADVVLGHHPHVLQGIEVYEGRPIVYSLGNFVFDSRSPAQAETGIFEMAYEAGGGWRVWVTPAWIAHSRMGPEYAIDTTRTAILGRFARLCRDLGTTVELTEGWLYVDCSASPTARVAQY